MMADMTSNGSTILTQSTPARSVSTKAIYTLVLAAIMVLIVVGNILVLVVLYYQRRRPSLRVTNLFLANLAVVDLSIGLLLLPMSISLVLVGGWKFDYTFCQLNGFINMTSGATSILTLAAISLDRYFAIVTGNKLSFKQASILLGVVWFWGVLIGLLPVLGWNHYKYGSYGSLCKTSFDYDKGYVLFTAVTCFAIPLVTMIYCYTRVFLRVRRHRKLMQHWQKRRESKNRNMTSEMRTAKIVVTVLLVFAGAWTPFVLVHLLELSPDVHIPGSVFTLVTLFAAMHSFCNPIIYTSMNRKFRADLLQLFPCLKRIVRCCSCCCKGSINEVNDFVMEPTGFADRMSQMDSYKAGSIVVYHGHRNGPTNLDNHQTTITEEKDDRLSNDDGINGTENNHNEAYQVT